MYHACLYLNSGGAFKIERDIFTAMPFNSYITECQRARKEGIETYVENLKKQPDSEELADALEFYQGCLENLSYDGDAYVGVCMDCDCHEERCREERSGWDKD